MASRPFTLVKTRIVRLTRLDDCGAFAFGPKGSLATQGFVKAETKWDIEDGAKSEQKNDWGDYCLNEEDDPIIKGGDLTDDFCNVDPDAYDLVSGARVVVAPVGGVGGIAAGVSIGYAIGQATTPGHFAQETWTKIGGACSTDGTPLWVYTVWPHLKGGRPGDQSLDRGTTTFQQSAKLRPAAGWGSGPYEDDILTIVDGEFYGQVITDVQPPAATNGAVELVDPEDP